MKSDSNGDIHLAHIGPKIGPPEPLTGQRIAIVFQPTARASPALIKTNQRSVDRLLRGSGDLIFGSVCAAWVPPFGI